MISAPFNFVPVSDYVFIPDWSNQISHDQPFSDAESGMIDLEIKAETDVYIRNGHITDSDKTSNEYLSFSNINGKYFIPASSMKGMIRNVMEILSFGKLTRISDNRYSLRDLHLHKYLDFFKADRIHCGWLRKTPNDEIIIEDHGIPGRISHKEIDGKFETEFCEFFSESSNLRLSDNRIAFKKYKMLEGNRANLDISNEFLFNIITVKNPEIDKRLILCFNDEGSFKGQIVLTGQPSYRKYQENRKPEGKFFEFVFPTELIREFSFTAEDQVIKDFLFIYKDSEDWIKLWRRKFENGEKVPVFFYVDQDKLIHFGLSYLYKLPSSKRLKQMLPDAHKTKDYDLAECIFGYSENNESLKGRVQFSHCFLKEGIISDDIKKPYLSSPKPSYYPIYLKQPNIEKSDLKKGYITILDNDAKIKGWKRYPVTKDTRQFHSVETADENLSPFRAIKEGATFNCKIRFHNLRKAEIGALLLSINPSSSFSHSIGLAKSYGYGKIKLNILSTHFLKFSIEEYKTVFNNMMHSKINNYNGSEQLKELKFMGIDQTLKTHHKLEYMDLADYVKVKRNQEYLEMYSSLIDNSSSPKKEKIQQEAKVSFFDRLVKQACLTDNLNKKYILIGVPDNTKLKPGQLILVEPILKGGNISELKFVKVIG